MAVILSPDLDQSGEREEQRKHYTLIVARRGVSERFAGMETHTKQKDKMKRILLSSTPH